jgi:hypothetical protein
MGRRYPSGLPSEIGAFWGGIASSQTLSYDSPKADHSYSASAITTTSLPMVTTLFIRPTLNNYSRLLLLVGSLSAVLPAHSVVARRLGTAR